jgi:hypothetical protein
MKSLTPNLTLGEKQRPRMVLSWMMFGLLKKMLIVWVRVLNLKQKHERLKLIADFVKKSVVTRKLDLSS